MTSTPHPAPARRRSVAWFACGIRRAQLVALGLLGLAIIPQSVLARGPKLCVWSWLLHLKACPACGTTRALCALLHGHPRQALAFNHNVLATAPLLAGMLLMDVASLFRKQRREGHAQGSCGTQLTVQS